jgi:acyl carrier protein
VTAATIAAELERFVRERFAPAGRDAVLRTIDLFDEGIVDSAGAIELIVHLESSCGVVIPSAALASDRFRSIDGIAAIVAELIAAGDPG